MNYGHGESMESPILTEDTSSIAQKLSGLSTALITLVQNQLLPLQLRRFLKKDGRVPE